MRKRNVRSANRHEPAGLGALGRLREGLAARNIVSPYPFATAAGAPSRPSRRTRKSAADPRSTHTGRCRSGTASMANTCPMAAACGTTAARQVPTLSLDPDARVSAAHGAPALSRGRRRCASVVGVVLLARRLHAAAGDGAQAAAHHRHARSRHVPSAAAAATSSASRISTASCRWSQDIPQWYGDTVAFWDGDALIMHTANVQAWTQHTTWDVQLPIRSDRDPHAGARRGGQIARHRLGDRHLRQRGACIAAGAHSVGIATTSRPERGGQAGLGGMHARAVPDRRLR